MSLLRKLQFSALTVCLLLAGSAESVQTDETTARYFHELRRRQLFGLAEGYCLDRLQQETLPERQRTAFTLELARTFQEHARFTTGDEQADLWRRAAETIDAFLQANPQHPERLVFQVQRAFVPAVQGETLRWQVELFPENAEVRVEALQALEDAVARLGRLNDVLQEALKERSGGADGDALPHTRLLGLWDQVRFRLATTHLDRAKLLPSSSADRSSAVMDAEKLFREVAGGPEEQLLTWQGRVGLAECDRLRGAFPEAESRLTAIVKKDTPREIMDQAVAERVRVLLDSDRPDVAAATLLEYRKHRSPEPGELRFLNVRALIALWNIAESKQDETTAQGLMEQIESRVARADDQLGGYWGQRCRVLRDQFQETRRYGAEVFAIVRQARAAYAGQKTDEAIEHYGTAAQQAFADGDHEIAMELGFTRASILLSAESYTEAAQSFRELAERFSQDGRAAEAHLLWAFCLGKLYDQDRQDANRDAYAAALEQHRGRFRDDPSHDEATWMLARLEEAEGRVVQALELYRSINLSHERGSVAIVGVARCYERILELLRQDERDATAWQSAAVGTLTGVVSKFPPEAKQWTLSQAEVALRLARIVLNRQPSQSSAADRFLQQVLAAGETARQGDLADTDRENWNGLLKTARQLRIITLAGQSGSGAAQAMALVREISEEGTTALLAVLDGLTALAEQADEATRKNLGEVQLLAATELNRQREQLHQADRRRLDRTLGEAYIATGQPRMAVELYVTLAKASPRDKQIRRTLAELQTAIGTPDSLKDAKKHWARLETLEKPGTPAWLEARLSQAQCCFALEEDDECRKLLEVTRLLYPNLGGEPLRSKFAELQRALDRAGR